MDGSLIGEFVWQNVHVKRALFEYPQLKAHA